MSFRNILFANVITTDDASPWNLITYAVDEPTYSAEFTLRILARRVDGESAATLAQLWHVSVQRFEGGDLEFTQEPFCMSGFRSSSETWVVELSVVDNNFVLDVTGDETNDVEWYASMEGLAVFEPIPE